MPNPTPPPASNGRNIDIRAIRGSVEIRAEADGSNPVAYGYIARFNVESETLDDGWGDPFVEIIAPGAFANSLASGADIVALTQHDSSKPLGRLSSGGLTLREDEQGLAFECRLPAGLSYASDLATLIRDRITPGNSFGFTVRPGGDTIARVGDRLVRTLLDVELIEVSIGVTWPAYSTGTISAIRSHAPRGEAPPQVAEGTPRRDAALRRLRLASLSVV